MKNFTKLLALLLCLVVPAHAAVTLHSNGESTFTNTPAVAISSVGDSLLVACVAADGSNSTTKTVSDDRGNTWARAQITGPLGSTQAEFWYALVTSANASTTITYSGNFSYMAVASFSGTATSSVTDGSPTSATASFSTSVQPGSITPSQANGLLVTCFSADAATGGPAVNSSFSITDSINSPSNEIGGLAYLVQTSAAVVNPTWSGYTTTSSMANMQAFKVAGGAATAVANPTVISISSP